MTENLQQETVVSVGKRGEPERSFGEIDWVRRKQNEIGKYREGLFEHIEWQTLAWGMEGGRPFLRLGMELGGSMFEENLFNLAPGRKMPMDILVPVPLFSAGAGKEMAAIGQHVRESLLPWLGKQFDAGEVKREVFEARSKGEVINFGPLLKNLLACCGGLKKYPFIHGWATDNGIWPQLTPGIMAFLEGRGIGLFPSAIANYMPSSDGMIYPWDVGKGILGLLLGTVDPKSEEPFSCLGHSTGGIGELNAMAMIGALRSLSERWYPNIRGIMLAPANPAKANIFDNRVRGPMAAMAAAKILAGGFDEGILQQLVGTVAGVGTGYFLKGLLPNRPPEFLRAQIEGAKSAPVEWVKVEMGLRNQRPVSPRLLEAAMEIPLAAIRHGKDGIVETPRSEEELERVGREVLATTETAGKLNRILQLKLEGGDPEEADHYAGMGGRSQVETTMTTVVLRPIIAQWSALLEAIPGEKTSEFTFLLDDVLRQSRCSNENDETRRRKAPGRVAELARVGGVSGRKEIEKILSEMVTYYPKLITLYG